MKFCQVQKNKENNLFIEEDEKEIILLMSRSLESNLPSWRSDVEHFTTYAELFSSCAKLVGAQLIDAELSLSRRLKVGHKENSTRKPSSKERSATQPSSMGSQNCE